MNTKTSYHNKLLAFLFLTSIIASTTSSTTCNLNTDCKNHPYYICSNTKCIRKSLFPLTSSEITAIIILTIISMLATTAGVGGGAAVVPLSLIFLKFQTKEAVALANGLVLFNGSIKFLTGLKRKHPLDNKKTIVDYNIVLLFLPSILLGSVVGTVVSHAIPEIVQIVGLLIVLFVAFFKTLKKSNSLWRKENEEKNKGKDNGFKRKRERSTKKQTVWDFTKLSFKSEKTIAEKKIDNGQVSIISEVKGNEGALKQESSSSSSDEERKRRGSFASSLKMNIMTTENNQSRRMSSESNGGVLTKIQRMNQKIQEIRKLRKPQLDNFKENVKSKANKKKIMEEENSIEIEIMSKKTNFSCMKIFLIISVLTLSLTTTFLRGGKGFKSLLNVKQCDSKDWTISALYFLSISLLSFAGSKIVLSEQKTTSSQSTTMFTKKFIISTNIYGIGIGFISANVGIGGALILTPLLLSYNFLPEVVSYTGMYLVFLNKLVATTIFFLSGLIPISYLLFIGLFMIFGVILAEWKVGKIVRKLGRQSILSYAFVGIVFVAFMLVLYTGIDKVFLEESHGERSIYQFGSFCGG